MNPNKILLLFVFFTITNIATAQYSYPPTKEMPVVDNYFGTNITDNYRWLEDLKSADVQAWFKAQAQFADSMLDKIQGRDMLLKRMKEMQQMGGDAYGFITQKGNTFYYTKTKKDENLSKLYYRDYPNGLEQLLFDPETLGKGTQLASFNIDDAGATLALSLSKSGAEVGEVRFMNLATKTLLSDIVQPVWSGFSFEFTQDGKAFLYSKLKSADNTSDDLLKNMEVRLHVLGTDPETDKLIMSKANNPELNILPEHFPSINFSDDRKYIFLTIGSVKSESFVFFAPASALNNRHIQWTLLMNYDDEIKEFYTFGDQLYFLSHKGAPNYKIGVTNLLKPDYGHAKIIVPEGKQVIRSIQKTKSYLFYSLSDGINQYKYQIDPRNLKATKLALPNGINGSSPLNPRENDKLMVYNTGWLSPYSIYEYDATNQNLVKSKWFDVSGNYPDFNKLFAVAEVEVKSYDGTMVPLSIIYPKSIKMDGNAPCLLTGYGAYGSSTQPNFVDVLSLFLEQGACLAFAHVRGGGEKGESWHVAGMKATKPNTWKDFIACAEYLVDKKYTSPQKLIGQGMSAGGILIGRAITERPDLFAVAIDEVGVTNTLRLETSPNGDNQIPEFGSIKNEEDAKHLVEMDAQSKVKEGVKYPAVFVRSGMNDPRVSPWIPGKFAATLQKSSASGKPVLLYVNYNNGHFTSDIDVYFHELADMLAFALWQTGHPRFQIK